MGLVCFLACLTAHNWTLLLLLLLQLLLLLVVVVVVVVVVVAVSYTHLRATRPP